jgi:VWFA-related protein
MESHLGLSNRFLFYFAFVLIAQTSWANSDPSLASTAPQPNTTASAEGAIYKASFQSPQGPEWTNPLADLTQPEGVATYCARLSRGTEQSAALNAVCEFALSLRWKLPNIICDQDRNRYLEGELGEVIQRNKITAKVRYEDGQEQYTLVTVDGKSVKPASSDSSVGWSEGEFATGLRSIFLPQSAAKFKFSKKDVLHSTPVFTFEFWVEKNNNHLWYLEAAQGKTAFPGYRGRIWINAANLHLLRLEKKVDDVAADFPIQQVSVLIDYGDIDLADGSSFVLPSRAVDITCPTVSSAHCLHDELTFKHWHKFAARTRFLTGESTPPQPQPATPATKVLPLPDIASFPPLSDPNRGADVVMQILSGRIAEIEQERRDEVAAQLAKGKATSISQPSARTPDAATIASSQTPLDQLPVFRASVRLVLVPTVVRDTHGETIGRLQKENFRLFDERRPQVITQFSMENPAAVSEKSVGSANENRTQANAATRHSAYVFDDIHASLEDLVRVRDAASRHLDALPPGDRAAILTLSGTVVLDFTNNHTKLNEALRQIRPHPLTSSASVHCPDISYVQADLITNQNDAIALQRAAADALQCAYAGDSHAGAPARRLAETTAAQVLIAGRAESQTSFNMLKEAVRGISRMPGQRSIVLVSPGFPLADMPQAETQIIDDALHAGVVIDVIDPSGLSTRSAIEPGSASGSLDVLVDLASGSGGTFFHNRNDMDEGFRKTGLPESYYVLGFSPQKLDGKFHKLKVTLQDSEKLDVQARRGYFALKPPN